MVSRSPNDDEAFLGLRFFDLFGCGNHVSTVIVVSRSSAHKAERAADLEKGALVPVTTRRRVDRCQSDVVRAGWTTLK